VPAVLPKFPLDGYVMLFVRYGDLYYQEGNKLPIKLTHVGKKFYPQLISDDNRKVVFSRDDGNEYSINSDGTHELTILKNITDSWTAPFEPGTNKGILRFVPGTHQIIFETYLCKSQEFRSLCITSVSLADTDTGAIKKLADLGLVLQQNSIPGNVEVSPNGKMLAVGSTGSTDIYDMDGKIIRHDILPFKPSTPDVLFPYLFWLPDSSGLIAALPNTLGYSHAYDYVPASTLWRYSIKSNVAHPLPLDPAPMFDTFQVSPDGNWIVYGGLGYEPAVYLGNLVDGRTNIVGEHIQAYFYWGPDSQHFTTTVAGSELGSIDAPMFTLTCQYEQWIDAHHFTCFYTDERIRMAEIDAAGAIKIYDLGFGEEMNNPVFIKLR
jgi:dipeptidyl aminopeptidase/acylaminoacyl peptidase